MASDLPVLCSNKSGMKKLTENKANYFDPYSIHKIESSIQNIYNSKKVRLLNAKNTQKVAKKFNWKKTSFLTFDYIYSIHSNTINKNNISNKNHFKNYIANYQPLKFIKKNIFILSYSANFFLGTLLFYFLYFFSADKVFSLNYILTTSSCILLTQIFSANARNLILAENSNLLALRTLVFRIFLSFFIIFINYVISTFLVGINDPNLIIFSSLLVCFCWIREINVAVAEINNNSKYEFINLILFITFFIYFIINSLINFSEVNFYWFVALYSIIIIKDNCFNLFGKFTLKKLDISGIINNLNYYELSFLSGFFSHSQILLYV